MKEETASILITGDYHPNETISKHYQKTQEPEQLFQAILNKIKKADIAVTNLEIPATSSFIKQEKAGPHGKTDEFCIQALGKAGFNLVTFANNHTLDYNKKGITDTLEYCKKNNIDVVGAGLNKKEAQKPYIKEINNIKIAILNYSETEFNIASEKSAGANPLDLINITRDIKAIKKIVDHIIVIIHGGQDFVFRPSPRMVKEYRFIAEMGASAVIGHHTHYISSSEIYKGTPIVYSLGHLVYLYNKNDIFTKLFYTASLILSKEKCSIELNEYCFDDSKLHIRELNEKEKILFDKKREELNKDILDYNLLKKKWKEEAIEKHKVRYLFFLSGLPSIIFRIFNKTRKLVLLEKMLLLNKKRFLPIWNLSKCEHHSEGINYMFNKIFKKGIFSNE